MSCPSLVSVLGLKVRNALFYGKCFEKFTIRYSYLLSLPVLWGSNVIFMKSGMKITGLGIR